MACDKCAGEGFHKQWCPYTLPDKLPKGTLADDNGTPWVSVGEVALKVLAGKPIPVYAGQWVRVEGPKRKRTCGMPATCINWSFKR